MAFVLGDVRCWGQSGKHMLNSSYSGFDLRLDLFSHHSLLLGFEP
jgi:hypothetical protein